MRKQESRRPALSGLCTAALTTALLGSHWSPSAHAQNGPGANIDLQTFRPAMDSRGLITLDSSRVLGHKQLSFGLVTHWGRNLLRFEADDARYQVEHMLTPTVVSAVGVRLSSLELEFGLSLPFAVMAGDRDPDFVGVNEDPNDDLNHAFDGQGLGDLGVHGKVRVLRADRHGIGLGVIASLYLPTATADQSWIGQAAVTPQLTAVLDTRIGRLSLAFNGGVRVRTGGVTRFRDDMSTTPTGMPQPNTNQTIAVGSTLPVGAGLAYALAPGRLDLVAEVIGEVPLGGENFLPLEAVGGIKVFLARSSFLTLGGGAGLLATGGNPDLRAFMGIVFEPQIGDRDGDGLLDDIDACPREAEDFDDFSDSDGCPDLDNDRDGIPDSEDACANEPEDKDGHADDDGCPESVNLDRDGDGIADDLDGCPDDPEDEDEYADDDGCPDADNDGDGILDVDDLCPDQAEDLDSWRDADGCPDPDNDGDRIPDAEDACPVDPEVYNTVEDDDGCPDRGPVDFSAGKLVIMEKIYFQYDSAVIKKQSHPILEAVAETLQLNPELMRLEVQGHTDERGPDHYNLELSQARAESVVAFLIERGVAGRRLQARGYGETMPLDSRHNAEAWAKNRRVEFVILERDP